MKTLEVVFLESESNSFSWNDGLFAVQKKTEDLVFLWKIKEGKLHVFPDGQPNVIVTGKNNKGIKITDLVILNP